MPNLQKLYLGKNELQESQLIHLSKAPFGSLVQLDVNKNVIKRDQGLLALKKAHWKRLRNLNLKMNPYLQ